MLSFLKCSEGGIFVDGTIGTGGHTQALFDHGPETIQVIGLDRDGQALAVARERLQAYEKRLRLVKGNFSELPAILNELGIGAVNGILLDLGFSSFQLETPGRGFSFQRCDPLDMRMDPAQGITAGEWLARVKEKELVSVLKTYGEEKRAKLLARKIKAVQRRRPIRTTRELAELIHSLLPRSGRIHPATRTFQALRIAVNQELDHLRSFLESFLDLLAVGGRVCVISYHSLEDRLVKQSFLRLEKGREVRPEPQGGPSFGPAKGEFRRVVAKPVIPSAEEIRFNPRARGAKLRVGERTRGTHERLDQTPAAV